MRRDDSPGFILGEREKVLRFSKNRRRQGYEDALAKLGGF